MLVRGIIYCRLLILHPEFFTSTSNMLADPFDYHIFEPLRYDIFVSYFRKVLTSAERGEFIYKQWLDMFYHQAALFYHSQYVRIQKLTENQFRFYHGISNYDELYDYELQIRWQQFQKRVGFSQYYKQHRALCNEINQERNSIRQWLNNYQATTNIERELSNERPRLKAINALWFNLTIRNEEATILELRKLPYELYLKTKHWAKVRAAQILIHRALCQEQSCYAMGESWYMDNWEADLHVHHLTYDNKGNERYTDLVLLCSKHHAQWHRSVDLCGESKMSLIDDE